MTENSAPIDREKYEILSYRLDTGRSLLGTEGRLPYEYRCPIHVKNTSATVRLVLWPHK